MAKIAIRTWKTACEMSIGIVLSTLTDIYPPSLHSNRLTCIQLSQTVPHSVIRKVILHVLPYVFSRLLLMNMASNILDAGCPGAAYPLKILEHSSYALSINMLIDE